MIHIAHNPQNHQNLFEVGMHHCEYLGEFCLRVTRCSCFSPGNVPIHRASAFSGVKSYREIIIPTLDLINYFGNFFPFQFNIADIS